MRRAIRALCLVVLAWALAAVPPSAADPVFGRTKHASPSRGVHRLTAWPVGSCEQCHDQHDGPLPHDFALFADADNATCLAGGCHDGSYTLPAGNYHYPWPGNVSDWSQSTHALSQAPYPPIDGRPVSYCVQCHNPHGAGDVLTGLNPSLTGQLEEKGCYSRPGVEGGGCHGNDPAYRPADANDLYTVSTRPFGHDPSAKAKLHSWDWSEDFPYGKESRTTLSGDFRGARRHVECVDCHNPHEARSGLHTPGDNAAGPALSGSWGVEPTFGVAWSVPAIYSVIDFGSGTGKEYQLCLKCHSYFAYGSTPTPSESDQAQEFNPANRAYHPIVAEIPTNSYTTPSVANGFRETMEAPWDNGRHDRMTCSDCHQSGTPGDPAGPHGSDVQGILPEPAGEHDSGFCLRCHKSSVYAPTIDPVDAETGSRFDRQTTGEGDASHYFHVREQGIDCRECHGGRQTSVGGFVRGSAHGTNLFPGLLNGTMIISYTPGGCTPVCHDREAYAAGPE